MGSLSGGRCRSSSAAMLEMSAHPDPGRPTSMISYDRHRWFNAVFSWRGTALRQAKWRVLAMTFYAFIIEVGYQVGVSLGGVNFRNFFGLEPGQHAVLGGAAGFPDRLSHERLEQPLLGGAHGLGADHQRLPQPGPGWCCLYGPRRRAGRPGLGICGVLATFAPGKSGHGRDRDLPTQKS